MKTNAVTIEHQADSDSLIHAMFRRCAKLTSSICDPLDDGSFRFLKSSPVGMVASADGEATDEADALSVLPPWTREETTAACSMAGWSAACEGDKRSEGVA
jgi:hypothetical protein